MSMSTLSYERLAKDSQLVWLCCRCMFPNFSSTFFLDDLNHLESGNSFDILASGIEMQFSSITSPDIPPERHFGPPRLASSPINTSREKTRANSIKLCSLNINSIRGKFPDFHAFAKVVNPEVIAVQETKIDSSVTDSEILPAEVDYSIFRKDRSLGGGGVMLVIKQGLNPLPCPEIDTSTSESVWSKLRLNGHTHYFCCYYRPPDQSYEELQCLRNQLDQIRTLHPVQNQPSVHLAGDFNFRKIDWSTLLTKNGESLCNSEGLLLIDIARDNYLEQLVTFPTREDKTLDLIFTSIPGLRKMFIRRINSVTMQQSLAP